MKKRLFKIILCLTLTFGIAMMFTGLCYLNVVASEGGEIVETLGEGEEETTTTTTETGNTITTITNGNIKSVTEKDNTGKENSTFKLFFKNKNSKRKY